MNLKTCTACVLMCLPGLSAWAAEEDVIVIEMDGSDFASSSAGPTVSVWQNSAAQLEKQFKNKTLSQVLTMASSVPSIQKTLTAANGKKYVFLRYGDEDSFRKLLFSNQATPKFLAAAATVPEVLKLQQKYQLDMTVSRAAFEAAYPQATFLNVSDLKNNTTQAVFQLQQNPKKPVYTYYVFEDDLLTHTFFDDASYNAYLKKMSDANKAYTQEQEKKRQEEEAARQKALQEQEEQKRREAAKWQRALVEGGTTEQYLFGPRLIKGPPLERRKKQQEEQNKK